MTQEKENRRLPTEAEILDAVSKSGYLMDQDVATVLEDFGFHVQTSWPFEDPDKGESRELDVWAVRRIIDDGPLQLFVELFCECKSGEDRPFVFLSRRTGLIDQNVNPTHFVFPHEIYEEPIPNGSRRVRAFAYLGLTQHHSWFKADSKAVQFAKIVRSRDRWEAQHDGIYNAILMPLAKALVYRKKELHSFENPLDLCFPIVVLNSPMYLIDSATKPLQASRVSHVAFYRRLDATTVKGDYIVDFVTLDGLAEFVKQTVMPFAQQVTALAKSNPDKFLVKRPNS